MFINLNAGYRFAKGDSRPSRNYNVYISYAQIPIIELTPSVTFTKLLTSYTDGTTEEIRLSKDISLLNSDFSLSYQRVDYNFTYSSENLEQNIFSAEVFVRIFRKLYINFDYEGTFQETSTDSRIVLGLTQRF